MMFTNIPEWWMWFILAGLVAAMFYWDIQGRPKRLRILRFVAIVLVVVSLLMLYMQPSWVQESDVTRVAIVTTNADQEVLDSLAGQQVKNVDSFDNYLRKSQETTIDELMIVGDGLEAWELKKLNRSFAYLPSKGIVEGPFDYWPTSGIERSPLELSVGVQLKDSITIKLSGMGIATQSLAVTKDQSKVTFEMTPNLAGNLLYQLVGTRAKDTVFSEVLPIQVKPAQPQSVLVLTSAPSFELRNLKNHLAAAGFSLAERQKISKETYYQSFVNQKEQNLSRLTTTLLKTFQLVVVDGSAYDAISSSDRRNLLSQLEIGELGLVWIGEKGINSPFAMQKVVPSKLTFSGREEQITLPIQTWKAINAERIELQGQVVGNVKAYGLGRIVVPSLVSSYSLILKGEKDLYATIWNELLQPVIGKKWTQSELEVMRFARVNEPIGLIASNDKIAIDSVVLTVEEQWFLENNWEAIIWPKHRGWNTITVDEIQSDVFVFDSTDWPVQMSRQKQQLTTSYASNDVKRGSHSVHIQTPISRWYFFGLFLGAFGYLWVEQRVG